MLRLAALFSLSIALAPATAQEAAAQGETERPAWMTETYLHTTDAVALCLRPDPAWQNFCNGLMQGYADYAVVEGKICLPFGTTRRELVEIFTRPDVVVTTGYIDDLPAFVTAVQLFIAEFPCE